MPNDSQRRIRSFVRRQGRITAAQQRALDELLPRYGLDDHQDKIDFNSVFGRHAPTWLEIGFGNGDHLLALARQNPDWNYLGAEVHGPGVGRLLNNIDQWQITNIRIFFADAVDLVERLLPAFSLAGIMLLFPDPWPKKRHHKRRLLQPRLVAALARCLQPGAGLYIATDWEDYYLHILEVLSAEPMLILKTGAAGPEQARRPTRFETRGRRQGHDVWEITANKI